MDVTALLLTPNECRLLRELLDRSAATSAPMSQTRLLAGLRARLSAGGDQVVVQINASDGMITGVDANATVACVWADWDAGDALALTATGPVFAEIAEHTARVRPHGVLRSLHCARNTIASIDDGHALFVAVDDRVVGARRLAELAESMIDAAIDDIAATAPELDNHPFEVHLVTVKSRMPYAVGRHDFLPRKPQTAETTT